MRRGCVALMLFGLVVQAIAWTYGAASSTRTSLEATSLAVTSGAAAALCLLRSRSTQAERLAWTALAAGVASYAVGSILIVTGPPILHGHTPAGVAALRSLLFVGLMVAVVIWTRERLRPIAVDQWIDGALAGVAVAAVGTLLLEPHLFPAGRSAAVISGAVVQPLVVLMVLGFVTATVGIRGWRPSRSHLWILSALATLLVSSVAFAHDVSGGSYRAGSLVDAAWPLALAVLGSAALVTPTHSVPRQSDLPSLALPGLVAATMLAILILPDEGRHLPQALAAVAIGVVTLRLTLSLVISQRAHNELLHNSLHDGLTGVGNRTLLNDRLSHAIDMRVRDNRSLLVLVCDLDDFKSINDTWGAQAGDEVLVEAAARLASTLRDGDTVARVGGDEFAVLAEGVERERDLSEIAHRILAAFQQPFAISGHRVPVRLSIGASTLADCEDYECDDLNLLTQADIAMHVAKSEGKNRLQRFRAGMTLPDSDSPVLVEELTDAIAARRIRLAFQPVFDLRTGIIDGYEALARWEGSSGPVPPDVFIPMAERSGLAVKLGSQLLEQACRQLGKWSAAMGTNTLNLGVNLSPAQLNNEHLPSQLRRMLSKYGVEPPQLVLEITERALLSDSETALDVCRRLRRLGVRLAIDDFGVGYSALSHLHKFPVDIVKIDKSFVHQEDDTADTAAFIRGIVQMAEAMHLSTVIEGIETKEQLALAKDMGCGFAQGYLLGKPAAPESIKITEVVALSAAARTARPIAIAAAGA